MNITSCHVYSKSPISTVILTCRSALVLYHLNKGFIVVETEDSGAYYIPITVKEQINSANLHNKYSILTCKSAIPSIVNILNKINAPKAFYDTYVSNFPDDRHF